MTFWLTLKGEGKWIWKLEKVLNEYVGIFSGSHWIVQDTSFSPKSAMSMSQEEIERSICCIEQQLLVEDDSPLIHTALAELGLKQLSKYQLEV